MIDNCLIINDDIRGTSSITHDANIQNFLNMQVDGNFFIPNPGRNVRGAQATNARGNIVVWRPTEPHGRTHPSQHAA